MADHLVRALGFGLYLVGTEDLASARDAGSQLGEVIEAWADPLEPGSYLVVLRSGHRTSWHEAGIVAGADVASPARRAASASHPGSAARERLQMVSDACAKILGGQFDVSSLAP